MPMRRRTRTRLRQVAGALCGLVLALDVSVVAARALVPERATAEPTTTVPSTTTTTTTTIPTPQVPATTTLATPHGIVPTFDAPGGQQVGKVGRWYGYPMTMPVLEERDGWLRIELPERPNQSTAWVRGSDADLSSTPYRIVVSLSQTDVTLYQGGFPLFTVPAGIGAARTPTPLGSYFIAVLEKPGPPGYGPLVLDTSAHSEAIQSWEGSGDAVIALHGPITSAADAQIGTTGTRISNGCIRLHTADQLRFADVVLGTPIDIVA